MNIDSKVLSIINNAENKLQDFYKELENFFKSKKSFGGFSKQ